MKNLFLPIMVALVVAACGPRDVPLDGVNSSSNNNGGGAKTNPDTFITVTQNGDLSETCPGNPFKTIDSPAQYDDQIFSGKITASFQPGDRNCFRIGDVIDLQDRSGGPSRGKVKIKKAEVFHFSKLNADQAKAFNTSLDTLRGRIRAELDRVKALPKGQPGSFDPREMVSITYFEYLGMDGSGGGEEPTDVALTEILEIEDEGAVPPTCPKDYTPSKSIDLPEDKDADIKSGKIIGFLRIGDQNCYQIGSIVSLKAKPKNKGEVTPERAKLKIAWVEIIPVDKLNNDHAAILNMSLIELKATVDEQIKSVTFNAKNTVSITVFEYVK